MKPIEQLQSFTARRDRFTWTLTTHQQWLSKFTFIFLQKLAVAYRFISQRQQTAVATQHLHPQAGVPNYLLLSCYFYRQLEWFCDVTVLRASAALHIAVVF
jgi:hypothetical protein